MSWTDERIERLTKMWEGGSTASQIADELGGVSRNAVIGKAHRLGLKARPSPVKPNEKPEPAPRAAKPAAEAPPPRVSAARRRAAPPRQHRRRASARRHAVDPADPRPDHQAAAAHCLGRPRRLPASGPRRSAGTDPACPAAPPGASQAQPGYRQQDQPARTQRPHLPLADGPSRRSGLPFLRRESEPRLPLLRRTLRPRLPGAIAARPPPPSAAAAVWRAAGSLRQVSLIGKPVPRVAGTSARKCIGPPSVPRPPACTGSMTEPMFATCARRALRPPQPAPAHCAPPTAARTAPTPATAPAMQAMVR